MSFLAEIEKKLKKIPLWLFILFLTIFILRIPSFFYPYAYGDECIYLTLGEAIRHGVTLYKNIHDNKPPLLYLLAGISGNLFWFKILLAFWNLVTIYAFFLVAKCFFPKKRFLNRLSVWLFAFLTTLPFLEGNIANAEIFMILPILAGILRLFCGKKRSANTFFVAGIFFSLAACFKMPAVFDFFSCFIFFAFFTKQNFKEKFKNLKFFTLGFFLPLATTFVYFFLKGAFGQYVSASFLQNIGYLSSWEAGSHKLNLSQSGLMIRTLILLAFVFIFYLIRKKLEKTSVFIFLWFSFSLYASLLSGRPYPHYLIQILPPLCLLLVLLLSQKLSEKTVSAVLFLILSFSLNHINFWSYPNWPYYKNFIQFVFGAKNNIEYLKHFGSDVPYNYEIARFLLNNTQKEERVFIWGDSPCVYALSRRLPVGRYTASYHIIDFNGFQETLQALKEQKPRFIIDLKDEKRPFPYFNSFIDKNYSPIKEIGSAQIYISKP